MIFYVLAEQGHSASSTQHHRFPGARETRETRRRLSACVRVRGKVHVSLYIYTRIMTILSRSVMKTNNSAK